VELSQKEIDQFIYSSRKRAKPKDAFNEQAKLIPASPQASNMQPNSIQPLHILEQLLYQNNNRQK